MSEFFQGIPYAILLLVLGFLLLVKGADAFVEGCSSIAKRFHVPSLIIGMTIVAMGTSLPETAVSITASVSGNNALAVSNAVGSNIFNLMIVVGVCAVLTPVAVQIGILKRDFPLSIGCALLLLILGAVGMTLGRVDGVVFIVLFALFLLYMIRSARKSGKGEAGEEAECGGGFAADCVRAVRGGSYLPAQRLFLYELCVFLSFADYDFGAVCNLRTDACTAGTGKSGRVYHQYAGD